MQNIDDAADHDELFLASISIWELGMLASKRRIKLGMDCSTFVRQALNKPGLKLAQLAPEIAIESSYLPGSFHGDPADRILVSTARNMNLSLVTSDSKIINYASQGFVKVIPI